MPPTELGNLVLKLTIDDKTFTASLNVDREQFQKLNQEAERLLEITGTPKRQVMLDEFARQLMTLEGTEEEVTTSIQEFIKTNQVTEKEITNVTNALREQQSTLGIGSKEWKLQQTNMSNLNNALLLTLPDKNNLLQIQVLPE